MPRKKNIIELTRCTVAEYKEMEKLPIRLLVDNVRSMHNIGSFFRTGDAFGIEEIILAGITGCPPHPEIAKTALGAEESVAWRYVNSAVSEIRRLKDAGWKICVLEQAHGSVPLDQFKPIAGEQYVLVCGNEVEGVDQKIVDEADTILEIPQCGVKHSLNVSVSTGIALWQLIYS